MNATSLRAPYLLFLADAIGAAFAKTAFGVRDWAPERCRGQLRLPGCRVDLGLPDMTPEVAAAAGIRSLLLGTAIAGGDIPEAWHAVLYAAARAGMDIISGTHVRLASVPNLESIARAGGGQLIDVRHPRQQFPTGTGEKRSGKRLLTVGTDCALGKKYTALALARAMQRRGIAADFRATGQTGIMISGSGIAIDAVTADFMAGAVECLSPHAAPDHWDIIEGQGSLFHPAYAGVTAALIHGSQPDALILCHDPTRTHVASLPAYPLPTLEEAAELNLTIARRTNPQARLAGVAFNTSTLGAQRGDELLSEVAARLNVPCVDPMKSDLNALIDNVLAQQ